MNQTSVNQRIEALVKLYCKGNKSAFAKKVGISSQGLGEIIGGRQSAPSFIALQKIALALPQVRLEWLLLGQGEMIRPPLSETEELELQTNRVLDEIEEENKKGLHQSPSSNAHVVGDEAKLLQLLAEEGEIRANLAKLKQIEFDAAELLVEDDYQKLVNASQEIIENNALYLAILYERMKLERAMMRQEARLTLYQVSGEPDATKNFGGLLSNRLDISVRTAERLVSTGKIRAVLIEGEGYRVTEQAVREFLGEA